MIGGDVNPALGFTEDVCESEVVHSPDRRIGVPRSDGDVNRFAPAPPLSGGDFGLDDDVREEDILEESILTHCVDELQYPSDSKMTNCSRRDLDCFLG